MPRSPSEIRAKNWGGDTVMVKVMLASIEPLSLKPTPPWAWHHQCVRKHNSSRWHGVLIACMSSYEFLWKNVYGLSIRERAEWAWGDHSDTNKPESERDSSGSSVKSRRPGFSSNHITVAYNASFSFQGSQCPQTPGDTCVLGMHTNLHTDM